MIVQSWTYNQLTKVRQYRPELVDSVVEEVLNRQTELQWLVVLGAYLDEEINLGKAAELLDMHALELKEKFLTQGIPIRHGVDTLEEAHAEVAAILQWNMTVSPNGVF